MQMLLIVVKNTLFFFPGAQQHLFLPISFNQAWFCAHGLRPEGQGAWASSRGEGRDYRDTNFRVEHPITADIFLSSPSLKILSLS